MMSAIWGGANAILGVCAKLRAKVVMMMAVLVMVAGCKDVL